MECPFCNNTLICDNLGSLHCMTFNCIGNKLIASSEIWQTLIDGKRAQVALDVALEGLETIEVCETTNCCTSNNIARLTIDKVKEITKQKGKENV